MPRRVATHESFNSPHSDCSEWVRNGTPCERGHLPDCMRIAQIWLGSPLAPNSCKSACSKGGANAGKTGHRVDPVPVTSAGAARGGVTEAPGFTTCPQNPLACQREACNQRAGRGTTHKPWEKGPPTQLSTAVIARRNTPLLKASTRGGRTSIGPSDDERGRQY